MKVPGILFEPEKLRAKWYDKHFGGGLVSIVVMDGVSLIFWRVPDCIREWMDV